MTQAPPITLDTIAAAEALLGVPPFAWPPGDATALPEADEEIARAPVIDLAGWMRRGALSSARLNFQSNESFGAYFSESAASLLTRIAA